MTEEDSLKQDEAEALSEIFSEDKKGEGKDAISEELLQPNILELISSPVFKEYNLDEMDIKIVSMLFKSLLNGKDEVRVIEVLKKICNKKIDLLEIKRFTRLMKSGILETTGSRSAMDGIGLLRSGIRLSEDFLNRIYNFNTEEANSDIAEPYKDNMEYLSEQFERIRILSDEIGDSRIWRRKGYYGASNDRKKMEEELKRLEAGIEKRLSKTGVVFPFEAFKKKKGLTLKEELIILSLLRKDAVCRGEEYLIDDLLGIISLTPYERLTDKRLFQKDGRLIKERIIEICTAGRSIFGGERIEAVKLNNKIKWVLLGEKKRQKKEKMKGDNFFEVVKPSVALDKVILHPKTNEELKIAVEKIQGNTSNLLAEWGIKGSLQQAESIKMKKRLFSVIMLFYGPPGTGKTLAANAAAHTLNRSLITFDCSKIVSMWFGESQKNVKKIFDKYKEMAKGMRRPPVLLLNEADQFLHKRVDASWSTGSTQNEMQNIFLEQLEKFEGILIATTNLVELMDSAFSRRFHHKIEFKRPMPEERLRLWQIHIPEKAPLAADVNLRHLSEEYDLSGGQIALAVQNAATMAAMRGNKICQRDLISACEQEMAGNFDEKARQRIGF
jgi:SpoVK/Ycf46/Vps4 family AAA+-type ATPase